MHGEGQKKGEHLARLLLYFNPFLPRKQRSCAHQGIHFRTHGFDRLFITDVPGQAQTYERKETEARKWQEGDPDSDYPFMAAEASMTGQTLEQVRDSILGAVNQLVPLAAHIEGKRMAAKKAIAAETNIKAIVNAAQVDFLAGLI